MLTNFSIKRFLLLSLLFNLPPILAITQVSLLFLPMLLWVNIPVLYTGIASLMGTTHFKIAEFGAMPLTITAYIVVVAIWLVLAAIITLLIGRFKR
ncbi:hypothetical protein [Thalassotalea ganghwensis]